MKTYENFITDLFKKRLDEREVYDSFNIKLNKIIKNDLLGLPYINDDLETIINYSECFLADLDRKKLVISLSHRQGTFFEIDTFVTKLRFYLNYNFKGYPTVDDITIESTISKNENYNNYLKEKLFNPNLEYDFDYKSYFKKLIIINYHNRTEIYNLIFNYETRLKYKIQDWLLDNYPGEYDKLEKCIFPDLKEKYSHLKNDLF